MLNVELAFIITHQKKKKSHNSMYRNKP